MADVVAPPLDSPPAVTELEANEMDISAKRWHLAKDLEAELQSTVAAREQALQVIPAQLGSERYHCRVPGCDCNLFSKHKWKPAYDKCIECAHTRTMHQPSMEGKKQAHFAAHVPLAVAKFKASLNARAGQHITVNLLNPIVPQLQTLGIVDIKAFQRFFDGCVGQFLRQKAGVTEDPKAKESFLEAKVASLEQLIVELTTKENHPATTNASNVEKSEPVSTSKIDTVANGMSLKEVQIKVENEVHEKNVIQQNSSESNPSITEQPQQGGQNNDGEISALQGQVESQDQQRQLPQPQEHHNRNHNNHKHKHNHNDKDKHNHFQQMQTQGPPQTQGLLQELQQEQTQVLQMQTQGLLEEELMQEELQTQGLRQMQTQGSLQTQTQGVQRIRSMHQRQTQGSLQTQTQGYQRIQSTHQRQTQGSLQTQTQAPQEQLQWQPEQLQWRPEQRQTQELLQEQTQELPQEQMQELQTQGQLQEQTQQWPQEALQTQIQDLQTQIQDLQAQELMQEQTQQDLQTQGLQEQTQDPLPDPVQVLPQEFQKPQEPQDQSQKLEEPQEPEQSKAMPPQEQAQVEPLQEKTQEHLQPQAQGELQPQPQAQEELQSQPQAQGKLQPQQQPQGQSQGQEQPQERSQEASEINKDQNVDLVSSSVPKEIVIDPEEERKEKEKQNAYRQKVLAEILTSEQTYVKNLDAISAEFVVPIKRAAEELSSPNASSSLSGVPGAPALLSAVVSNLETLVNFHHVFLADLIANPPQPIARVVLNYSSYFKLYTSYLHGYEKMLAALEQLNKFKRFQRLLSEASCNLRKRAGLEIVSYLIMPVQRIPRYLLLLKELLKYTPDSHPEYPELVDAVSKMGEIAHFINESKRLTETLTSLITLEQSLVGDHPPLVEPSRRIIRQDDIMLVKSKKQEHGKLFVFNDMILWTTQALKCEGSMSMSAVVLKHKDITHGIVEVTDGHSTLTFKTTGSAAANTALAWMDDATQTCEAAKRVRAEKIQRRKDRLLNRKAQYNSGTTSYASAEWSRRNSVSVQGQRSSIRGGLGSSESLGGGDAGWGGDISVVGPGANSANPLDFHAFIVSQLHELPKSPRRIVSTTANIATSTLPTSPPSPSSPKSRPGHQRGNSISHPLPKQVQISSSTVGLLSVMVEGASNLPPRGKHGNCSAYCSLSLAGEQKQSTLVVEDLHPFWDEEFMFAISDLEVVMTIKVKDYDMLGVDVVVGSVSIKIRDVKDSTNGVLRGTWPLLTRKETGLKLLVPSSSSSNLSTTVALPPTLSLVLMFMPNMSNNQHK